MFIHFWRDETTDALQRFDSTAAKFWKLSNACGLISLVFIAGAVWLAVAAFLAGHATLADTIQNPGGIFEPALICWILSSAFITAYCICLAIVAYRFKDYPWAIGNILFWPIAVIYSYVKGREIRQGWTQKVMARR